MSDGLKRQSVLWLLLGGLPLVAIADIRRPATQLAELAPSQPSQVALEAGQSTVGAAADRPERLPDVGVAEESWFVAAQAELRARGADYVRLEKWHCEPAVYYFECRLAASEQQHAEGPHPLTGLSVSAQAATQDVVERVGRLRQARRVSRAARANAVGDVRLNSR